MANPLKKLWKKITKKSGASAKQAYKKKVKAERTQAKKKVVTSNYDKVKTKAHPTTTKPSGSKSGGSSSNSTKTSWGTNKSGGTARHRSGTQSTQRRSQPAKKQNQTKWQSWVQKQVKTKQDAAAKSAREAYQKKAKENRNALGTRVQTRTAGNLKSQDLTSEDYLKLQNASRIGGKAGTASLGKELAEKVGSRTAYSAKKGKLATGIMQGLAYGDVLEGGVGTYNKEAREEIEKVKKSAAYNVGYGVGQVGSFALGGTTGAAKALVSGGAKAGAKAASKSAAKKFAKNRVAEMAVETPLNVADAIKMSRDEDGKIDKKKLAEYAALNTAITGGAGAAMEGAAIKFTKKNGEELIKLQAKANKGIITKEEGQKLKKLYDKLNDARKDTTSARSNAAESSYQEGRKMVSDARIERGKAKGAQKREAARAERTEAYNDKVDRAVKQSADSEHKIKNEKINDRVSKYVEEVRERNRKALNDKALVYRNRDIIEEGGSGFTDSRKAMPDVEAAPEGKRANQNTVKSTRKAARQTLASYAEKPKAYSKEETKEINDTVDKISNMLAHGDHADAMAEAENLAKKYGQVETSYEDVIPGADDYARAINEAKRFIYENAWHMPDGAARTLNEFYEHIGGRENVGGYIKLRKGFQGHTRTRAVDDQIHELTDGWPELFGDLVDPSGYVDEVEVFKRMGEIVQTSGKDIPRTQAIEFTDDEMEQIYRELADDIVQQAQKNADSYKDVPVEKEYHSSSVNPENVSEEYKDVFDQYIKSTDEKIADYVNDIISGKPVSKTVAIGETSAKEADLIKEAVGIDANDFKVVIGKNDVEHIVNRHGTNGKADHTMADANDIARAGYIMDNADSIKPVLDKDGNVKTTKAYRDSNGNPSPQIEYKKQIDGHVYVISTVVDSKDSCVRVSSMYMEKATNKKASQMGAAHGPDPNARDASVSASDSTVPQNGSAVKDEPRDVNNPEANTNPEVSEALKGSKKHQEYVEKPRAEQIKEQTPSLEEFKKQVDSGEMSGYETSKHLETIYDAGHFEPKEIKDQLAKDLNAGSYIKVGRESHADAIARAEKSVEKDWRKAYNRQIAKSEAEDLTAYDYAERKFVMEKLESMVRNGEGDIDELVKLHRDLSINEVLSASNTGAALNAAKIMKRMTPAGRAQLMLKKVESLNKKFGGRLKGDKLELTDEQYNRILKAESEEEAANVLDEVSQELMDQIPSTVFEKLNEIRRFTMLANLRTHERNVIGNTVFAGARSLSDALEVAAYKIPAVRNRVEKLGGTVEMNRLSYRRLVKENRKFLDDQFDRVYKASGSQTQYKDAYQTGRPEAFKSKRINKLLDANYTALEKEDMLMFKPTFRKAYAQWCESRGIKDMSSMTEEQMEQAGKYALYKAEYATFRDDSYFARKICGYKTKTAGKKGKTALGTAAYRAANMAIEGHLPFVKTPVNILRRSIDYSPLGIAKGISKLATADSAEMFKQGVHEFCSGMTGTGVAIFGALLASQGVVTVDAGKVSGDSYYDRDMGYQDYSLVVGPGDHKYSLSIDWASPMQTALFMGAAMQEKLEEDGFSMQDIMDIGVKVFNPMLDMSFMSTSRDTFDSFMDKVYRNGTGDNADWTGAITQTLFGKVPQGYLGSLVPQMVSQAATGSDKYQRDTRSTKEGAVAASWDSWGRQIANKFPVLRQTVNNPKVDRFGNDKTNTGGDNIVLRYINAMVNPSNMKRITLNDTDKELISIFNQIPEGTTQKKYFFYDFTGNPDYELANGKRMSYDELYKYGKTKRQSQSDNIQNMFDAKSYKNMSNNMKVEEIVKYKKDISEIQADMKVYGAKYTVDKIVGSDSVPEDKRKGGKADATAWKILQDMKGSGKETRKEFVNFWITKETLMARAHDTGYETKALACAYTGNRDLGRAYDVNTDKMDRAFAYIKEKGKKKGYDMYSDASCNIMAGLDKAQVESTSKPNRSWSAAGYDDIDESTYRAMGFDWNSAQSGAGLRQKYGYDVNQLIQMASDAKYEFDADKNGSLKKDEVIAYIDSLGIDDSQHKACLFEYLTGGGVRNPYDSIDDYLKWGEDSRDDDSYGGRRGWRRGRRGWGHGHGGGGGGGAGGSGEDWDTYVSGIFDMKEPKVRTARVSASADNQRVSDFTKKSELNEAYRKRARKKQMINRKK